MVLMNILTIICILCAAFSIFVFLQSAHIISELKLVFAKIEVFRKEIISISKKQSELELKWRYLVDENK